jgi:predicted DNA-binding transcriptional regulator AlpA
LSGIGDARSAARVGQLPEAGCHVPVGTLPTPAILVLTEDEAAKLLRLSVRTMQRLRVDGDGPRFVMLTSRRIGYAIGDLQAWVHARSVASTGEATARSKVPRAT